MNPVKLRKLNKTMATTKRTAVVADAWPIIVVRVGVCVRGGAASGERLFSAVAGGGRRAKKDNLRINQSD